MSAKFDRVLVERGPVRDTFQLHSYRYEPGDLCRVLEVVSIRGNVREVELLRIRVQRGGHTETMNVPPDHVGWLQ